MAKMRRREELLRKLAMMPAAVRSAAKQALAQSADELEDAIRAAAPKGKTGRLKRSIKQSWGGQKVRYASLTGAVAAGDRDMAVRISAGNSETRYAHLVEFGTAPHENAGMFPGTHHPGIAANPFFYPTYRKYRRRIRARIAKAVRRSVATVAKS